MEQAFILTKNNCINCNNLKMFLKMALQDKYKNDLVEIHQELNAEKFNELVKQFNVLATPAIIYQNEILRTFEPQPLVNFLTKHFGKK
jgi:glutaredoxin-like protein NrdH